MRYNRPSKISKSAMHRYLNGMLTNEQVIEELLKLAKDIAAANAEGQKLGLNQEELAFYDALTRRADCHHQGADRCPAQKPHHRLAEKRKRPRRHASPGQAPSEKAQVSARGHGGRRADGHEPVRDVDG